MAQLVKNLLAAQETSVPSLGRKEPFEKGMATHSSILAWRIPRTEEPGGLQSLGSQRVGNDWSFSLSLLYILPCVKEMASGKLLYQTGRSAQCCDDLEVGEWVRRGHMYTYS